MALALGCLLGKWPWPWGACWGRCLEGLEGFGGFGRCLEGFGKFGAFAGWQTAALKFIESHCCGPGPGVPVGEFWRRLEPLRAGTAALKAHRKSLVALALGCLLGKLLRVKVWRVWKRTRSTPAVVPGAAPKGHRGCPPRV